MLETKSGNSRFKMDVVLLVKDFKEISENLTSYFEYHRTRQTIVDELLSKSSLN